MYVLVSSTISSQYTWMYQCLDLSLVGRVGVNIHECTGVKFNINELPPSQQSSGVVQKVTSDLICAKSSFLCSMFGRLLSQ